MQETGLPTFIVVIMSTAILVGVIIAAAVLGAVLVAVMTAGVPLLPTAVG